MLRNWQWVLLGILVLISGLAYLSLGYQTPRWETQSILILYSLLFISFLILYYLLRNQIILILLLGILFRCLFLFSLPSLSDDVYRFIWDSELLTNGINPFRDIPEEYIKGNDVTEHQKELFELLSSNTQKNHTIYPPVPQLLTSILYIAAGRDVISTISVLHFISIFFEIGTLILILNILERFGLNKNLVGLYALNPLVILEFSGNLHHEGYLIFFVLLSLSLFYGKKLSRSAIAMSLAVASKLLPLMFLPLFISRLKKKDLIKYYAVAAISLVLLFLPFLNSDFIKGMSSSTALYFNKFEFNASVYYLVREIGFAVKGYNIIQTAGPRMAIITILMLIVFYRWEAIKRLSLPESFMWILVIYLSMTTIFHPWYLLPIIAFSVFTKYRFPILWSFLIFLTYAGYGEDSFSENYTLVIIEYVLVYGFMFFEVFFRKDRTTLSLAQP